MATRKSIPQAKKEQAQAAKAKKADWKAIELDYRAGIKTLRAIADQHSISNVAIVKRAKRDGWERDLSAKIRAKAEALVSKSVVSSPVSKESENAVVQANAEVSATVILSHRRDVNRARELVSKLFDELGAKTMHPDELESLVDWVSAADADDDKAKAQILKALEKSCNLGERADIAKKLVDALVKLVAAERTIYGIAEAAGGESQDDALLRIAKEDGLL